MSESGASPDLALAGRPAPPPEPPEAPSPLRLYLVRHAQSTWNESGRIQGQLDPPLSELGRAQAQLVAQRLAAQRWTGFYTSDLKRAAETAAAIASLLGREAVASPQLREIFLGEWEGLTREEIVERWPRQWEEWMRSPDYDLVPGGEGAEPFEARVRGALAGIFERHGEGGDVLVVTHGGVIQVALGQVLGRSTHGFFPFRTDNTSLTVLHRTRSRLVVWSVNDTCHLHGLTAGLG